MASRMGGRVALVTGGGGGIGEATGRVFAEEGGQVALVDTDKAAVEAAAAGIAKAVTGARVSAIVADLFLSCDESSYVTGATLMVDAGKSILWPMTNCASIANGFSRVVPADLVDVLLAVAKLPQHRPRVLAEAGGRQA